MLALSIPAEVPIKLSSSQTCLNCAKSTDPLNTLCMLTGTPLYILDPHEQLYAMKNEKFVPEGLLALSQRSWRSRRENVLLRC